MIRSVQKVIMGTVEHGEGTFWTYLICGVGDHGRGPRYDLIRIDNVVETMQRLGCELTLERCEELVREHENIP
jgi:hypothetical protein